jgi:hypothetical protein
MNNKAGHVCSGQVELAKLLNIAKEALDSIAFRDVPEASTTEYWSSAGDVAATVAMDTRIARKALKEIETGLEPGKEE